MANFALIGASGYIAPRHMNAILETENNLVAAFDPYDGIGIIDSYFPECNFFTEFERFDRYLDKLYRNEKQKIDYLVITSPNYLHDAHIRYGIRYGCNVICEKPLVLNPHNLKNLIEISNESKYDVYSILQLRLHDSIKKLKERVRQELERNPNKVYDIDLTYITSRGKWYHISWKGDESKSGGISTNIGIHFFDMLTLIFGKVESNKLYVKDRSTNAGYLKLKHARVRWFLSVDPIFLPNKHKKTYRAIQIDKNEFEFSTGFENLHTKSYQEILNGKGFILSESMNAISIVSDIRKKNIEKSVEEFEHPFIKKY